MAGLESNEIEVREQQALISRVLGSQQFRRTVRLSDFLRYVATRSATHPGATIPETDIGTAVFGRSPDYDTGTDNIVRVSAGDLRRRLDHYFLDEGLHEPLVCEMPRGGYMLVFRPRAATVPTVAVSASESASSAGLSPGKIHAASASPPTPTPAPQPSNSPPESPAYQSSQAAGSQSTAAQSSPPPAVSAPVPTAPVSTPGRASWQRWLVDPRTLVLLLLCVAAAAITALVVARSRREPWQRTAPLAAIWSDFLTPDAETDVVLADSSLALVKSITGSGVGLSDYLGYGYEGLKSDSRFDRSTQTALGYILNRNNGSIGDFQAARNIFALTAHPGRLVLGSAHDFTPEAIRNKNVILLGSSVSNPWVDLYRGQRSFVLQADVPGSVASIRNRTVQPGEQAVYQVGNDHGTESGLAVIAILPNIDPEKRVLILEGTDSQATLAASNFITSAAGARSIADRLPHTLTGTASSTPRHLEILLQSSKLLATPLEARILAVHARND